MLKKNKYMYKHISRKQYVEIVQKTSSFIIHYLIAQFSSFVHNNLIISRRCFYRESQVTHSSDDFSYPKTKQSKRVGIAVQYAKVVVEDDVITFKKGITEINVKEMHVASSQPNYSVVPFALDTDHNG
ncbi:hypothetical protein T10_10163 [Trichinella papuae]|uniref:Uncharacterized protein n=1 Tax=Trichinella papuae TaxID=268474 RepID=A0A0V1M0T5_9BILA|nr:hypothetical protein T10_9316 [Trichinella papuae]KRZ65336.1 hypothetical protein T10_10163 [Trichinella papuae]